MWHVRGRALSVALVAAGNGGLLAGEGKGLGAWATMRLLWSACMAVAGGREDDGEVLGTFSARVKEIIWEKKEATEGPLNKNDTLLASLLPLLYRT